MKGIGKLAHLVYGPEGTGKSWYAKSVQEVVGSEYLVLDIERRWHLIPDVQGTVIRVEPEGLDVIDKVLDKVRRGNTFKAIILDGFSELDVRKGLDIHEGEALEQRDWGTLLNYFIQRIAYLLPASTGAHLVATAHMDEKKAKTAKTPHAAPGSKAIPAPERTEFAPAVRGRFGVDIGHYFDLVTPMLADYSAIGKGGVKLTTRNMFFRPIKGDWATKNSFEHTGRFSDVLANPTFAQVLALAYLKEE